MVNSVNNVDAMLCNNKMQIHKPNANADSEQAHDEHTSKYSHNLLTFT